VEPRRSHPPSPLTAITVLLNADSICSDYFPRINSNVFTAIEDKDSYKKNELCIFCICDRGCKQRLSETACLP
jgi:hypothetical protein